MGNVNVAGLIKEADKAIKQREEATEQVAGLREILRFAVKAKEASPEETKWIAEAFPIRERKTAEERVAELEEQLAKAAAKAGISNDEE